MSIWARAAVAASTAAPTMIRFTVFVMIVSFLVWFSFWWLVREFLRKSFVLFGRRIGASPRAELMSRIAVRRGGGEGAGQASDGGASFFRLVEILHQLTYEFLRN